MFEKLLKNICTPAQLFWVVALFTIVYKCIMLISGIFTEDLSALFTGGLGLLWDLFWIYIVTFTIKKLCNLKYKNGAYVASLLFLFFWFKYDMSPPIDFK
jgi:hypothetical protein